MQKTKGRIIDKLHRYTYTWVGPQSPSKWESHRRIQQVSNGLVQLGLLGLWGRTSWESYYHPFIPHQKLETTRRILRDSRRWKLGSKWSGHRRASFPNPRPQFATPMYKYLAVKLWKHPKYSTHLLIKGKKWITSVRSIHKTRMCKPIQQILQGTPIDTSDI